MDKDIYYEQMGRLADAFGGKFNPTADTADEWFRDISHYSNALFIEAVRLIILNRAQWFGNENLAALIVAVEGEARNAAWSEKDRPKLPEKTYDHKTEVKQLLAGLYKKMGMNKDANRIKQELNDG